MPKNIIVCADGTGNKGGSTPDSNVYKVYKAVDKSYPDPGEQNPEVDEQIIFYDNGVGTEKNKILRAIGGAIGYGFEQNVCDLYEFLARNYKTGDRIYFFGFSRGASTVRACNGFIDRCGLIKGEGVRNSELKLMVKEAFGVYKEHKKNLEKAKKAKKLKTAARSHGAVNIQFMGIWDTVVALGFPKRTDVTGPVSAAINKLFKWAENLLDCIWPHSFYHYRLTGNVLHAYQALAIDDERTAFWPFVWREHKREADSVEQVWFGGMHSNVGGGYGRTGMASVPLHWMMLRAEKCGLKFHNDSVQKAFEDSHVHGRMYNSRDGAGMFYRYHPREIEKLCGDRLLGDIKLHRSVIERLEHRTANYAPGHIPGKFEVVESDPGTPSEARNPRGRFTKKWEEIRTEIDRLVLSRKRLYASMLFSVLVVFGAALWFWKYQPSPDRLGIWGDIADILDYFLFEFLDGLINYAVAQNPSWFIGAIIVFLGYLCRKIKLYKATVRACEKLRHLVICEKKECKDMEAED